MPKAFEDFAGDNDLLIPSSSLWTPSAAWQNGDVGHRPLSGGIAYAADPTGIYLPASNPSGDSAITIEVLYRFDQLSANGTGWIVRQGVYPDSVSGRNWGLYHSYNQNLYDSYVFVYMNNAGGNAWSYSVQIQSASAINYHLVFTFVQTNNTSIKGRHWRNGDLVQDYGAPVSTVNRYINNNVRLVVGEGTTSLDRGIGHLAIYPYEFTQEKVDEHYIALAHN